jgi:drug/metabolite transporter (DMT)-like permease
MILCFVALLYGTLSVSLRLLYHEYNPTASSISAARGVLACLGFLPLFVLNSNNNNNSKERLNSSDRKESSVAAQPPSVASSSSSSFFVAGLELAFWNFLAQGLLNIGLLSTSSARASFLTQTSVVFTPVISRIFGQTVPSNVWAACGLALIGLTVLSSVGTATAAAAAGPLSSAAISFATGDWFVLGGALSWSMYLFRLSKIAPKYDEINLQFVKTGLLAVLYIIWWVAVTVVAVGGGGGGGSSIFPLVKESFGWLLNGFAFIVLIYSAVGPGTVADVLQQQGQKQVSASEANVILSLEPVFTALCAWAVLGELTSTQEAIGGAIILGAALLATR